VDFNKIIARAKSILLTPKTEWAVIEAEPATTADIFKGYVLILAAVPAIAGFIKSTIIGTSVLMLGTFRVGFMTGLSTALLTYILSMVGVFVMALIVNALAPTFGAQKDSVQSLKVVAYSYTAAWVAGIATILPGLGILIALLGAIYSFYLLYTGLPVTMKCPPEKAVGYTAVSIVVAIVLSWVVTLSIGGIFGTAALMGGGFGASRSIPDSSDVKIDPSSPLGKLDSWSKSMEAAGKKMEAAQKSGDQKAQGEALGAVLGAALGGKSSTESLPPDRIKSFLPEQLAGLPRKSVSSERNSAMGLQVSTGEASYGDDDKTRLKVEITDMGGVQGMMLFAGWAAIEADKQTDTGYEKTYHQGGRIVHEEWNTTSNSGEYAIVLGDRFVAKVSGTAANVDQLKATLAAVDLAGLESLKNEGVKAPQ
jgi:hypothetical protein